MLAEIDINPNVIIVFVAMIIAGLKALIEKRNQQNQPPQAEEEEGYEELYEAYEAELAAQRQQLQIPAAAPSPLPTPVQVPAAAPPPLPTPTTVQAPAAAPPPLPTPTPAQVPVPAPQPRKVELPTLSAAEEAALDRFNSRPNGPRRKINSLSTKTRLKAHLSSPTAAREALLLAEIFGPPKALK